MAIELSRAGLWVYRQVRRTGLLDVGPIGRAYERVYARYKRHFEDPFYNLARRHPELFKGGHIIDAGANIGYTAALFAAAIDSGFKVWAFEPSSDNFSRLCATIAQRGLDQVITATRATVADRRGTIDLMRNPDHPGDHRVAPYGERRGAVTHAGGVERVRVTTIDDEVRAAGIAPVAFIKVDVQGYELQVCRGMTATLEANPAAAVVLEYLPALIRSYGSEPEDLSRFFAPRGYAAYRVMQSGRLEALDVHALPGELPAPGYIDILFTRAAIAADAL
jgi:FkbM family methyltransferase